MMQILCNENTHRERIHKQKTFAKKSKQKFVEYSVSSKVIFLFVQEHSIENVIDHKYYYRIKNKLLERLFPLEHPQKCLLQFYIIEIQNVVQLYCVKDWFTWKRNFYTYLSTRDWKTHFMNIWENYNLPMTQRIV